MLAHSYNIIIYHGDEESLHSREVVNVLNDTDKRFISMLIAAVKMPGAETYNTQMGMHTSILNTYISLARTFQKHLFGPSRENGVIEQGRYIKWASQ